MKIAMCVRNRLGITKKAIEALHRHTTNKFHLYVYDNLTNHQIGEHFAYYQKMFTEGKIIQVTFNTEESTHNAFSKATALNQFGHNHLQEPDTKGKYKFLAFIDNDMLVTPGWDKTIIRAWDDVKKLNLKDVKVIAQHKGGGIKYGKTIKQKVGGVEAYFGKLGGSGFWTVKPNFYTEVGYLELKPLVGFSKKHDQNYWKKLDQLTDGRGYILALKKRLVLNTGGFVGSICNQIGYGGVDKNKLEKIKFIKANDKVEKYSFDDFYRKMWKDDR